MAPSIQLKGLLKGLNSFWNLWDHAPVYENSTKLCNEPRNGLIWQDPSQNYGRVKQRTFRVKI